MKLIKGTAKLYDAAGKQVIATIDYQMWKPAKDQSHPRLAGEFTLDRDIGTSDDGYTIELEDGHTGHCFVKLSSIKNPLDGPSTYSYIFGSLG